MTVKELIEKLQQLPQDSSVRLTVDAGCAHLSSTDAMLILVDKDSDEVELTVYV